ncbi:hypothetical protein Q7P37_009364 [Cladosporium fusiforme]
MSTPQIDEASYNSPPDGTYITRNLAASAVKPDGEGGTASEANRRRTTANLGGFAMKGKITTCCPQAAMLSRIIMENRQQFPHRFHIDIESFSAYTSGGELQRHVQPTEPFADPGPDDFTVSDDD